MGMRTAAVAAADIITNKDSAKNSGSNFLKFEPLFLVLADESNSWIFFTFRV